MRLLTRLYAEIDVELRAEEPCSLCGFVTLSCFFFFILADDDDVSSRGEEAA